MVLTGFKVSTWSLKWRSRLNHGAVYFEGIINYSNQPALNCCEWALWILFWTLFWLKLSVFFSLFYLKAIIALAYVTLAFKVISFLCNVSLLISVGTVSKEKNRDGIRFCTIKCILVTRSGIIFAYGLQTLLDTADFIECVMGAQFLTHLQGFLRIEPRGSINVKHRLKYPPLSVAIMYSI